MSNIEHGPQSNDDQGFIARHKRALVGSLAAATFMGGAAVVATNDTFGGSSDASAAGGDTGFDAAAGCDNLVEANAANVGNNYDSAAFLERVDLDLDAVDYVDGLFDEDGPLSNKGDLTSLAAFMAVVASPATDGETIDPEYAYDKVFANKIAQYNNQGLGAAREDCAKAYEVAVQTAKKDSSWANAGDLVTAFTAIRNENNDIIGMSVDTRATLEDLGGVTFSLSNSTDGVDGFTEVLVAEDGVMYATGVTMNSKVKFEPKSEEDVQVADTADESVDVAGTDAVVDITAGTDAPTETSAASADTSATDTAAPSSESATDAETPATGTTATASEPTPSQGSGSGASGSTGGKAPSGGASGPAGESGSGAGTEGNCGGSCGSSGGGSSCSNCGGGSEGTTVVTAAPPQRPPMTVVVTTAPAPKPTDAPPTTTRATSPPPTAPPETRPPETLPPPSTVPPKKPQPDTVPLTTPDGY